MLKRIQLQRTKGWRKPEGYGCKLLQSSSHRSLHKFPSSPVAQAGPEGTPAYAIHFVTATFCTANVAHWRTTSSICPSLAILPRMLRSPGVEPRSVV